VAIVSGAVLATAFSSVPAGAAPATDGSTQAVIVVLRNQHPDLKPKFQAQQRQQAVAADQAGIVTDLRAHGATRIQQLDTVSAVAATATQGEISRLAANPAVAAVVPDRTIPRPEEPTGNKTASQPGANRCPAGPGKPLLEPQALDLTHTTQAQSLVTGKGVKIAFMADGLDVDNPDFIRPDGSHVFFDFQDFSGDGVTDDSGGDEAFGDASSLAAQGNQVYDLAKALPNAGLAPGCAFRILGFAPGASLAAIKVFGQFGATESGFVRGIDYAVNVDKVDVLSQSFGGNIFPDGAADPIAIADEAAVSAGVTVVASSGDSGTSGTQNSPASAPDVIGAGGTTAYRLNAIDKGYPSYVDDNITALSSGGPSLDNKYVDLVAPAMTGMALCTPNPKFWDSCGQNTEVFGGTSQAAPFVAGASALVINAYEQAHHGVRPAPRLVRQLLTGTATDLNAPADQQGAGLLNTAAAVRAALALGAASKSSTALIPSATQLNLTGRAGSVAHATETLTNTASVPQVVTATSRALGRKTFAFTTTAQVTGATLARAGGPGENPPAAAPFTFDVPAGTPWLDAEMAWPGTSSSGQLDVELFDPAGRLVQESYDYGFTDYQHVGVHDPTPGRWTARILWNNGRDHLQEPLPTPGSFRGAVSVRVTGSQYGSAGVRPVTRYVPAGGSATFDLNVPLPDRAGDAPASIQFDSNLGTHLTVPAARRVLIPSGGSFGLNITGGVGRDLNQYASFYLDVPHGKRNLTIDLSAPDPATQVDYFLASPDGQILSGDTNAVETAWNSGNPTATGNASLTVNQPAAGRWELMAVLFGPSSGTEFSEHVTGTVRYDTVRAHATGLPNSPGTTVTAAKPVTSTITVTNNGRAGEYFFLDPRLTAAADVTLPPVAGDSTFNLPEDAATTAPPQYQVPTHTSTLAEDLTASVPVGTYLEYADGNPGPYRTTGSGNHTVNSVTADQLAFGRWITDTGELGPFQNAAPPATATISMTAHTQPFDTGASPSTGDYWLTAVGGAPGTAVFIPAGGTANLTLTLKPTATPGTVVRGVVYVDTRNNIVGQGSELTGIPYTYTAG
jgi:hypothetical protein